MGCFSYLCKKSGEAVLSDSFDGDAVRIFLLKGGKVIEEMHGNYDSYGRVFDGKGGCLEWKHDWGGAINLHYNSNKGDGFVAILDENFDGDIPTEIGEDDPNQGWGDGELSCDEKKYVKVLKPYHKVY